MKTIDKRGRLKIAAVTSVQGFMEETPSGGSWQVQNGNLQFPNPQTGLWHTLFVTGPLGFEILAIGAGEATAPDTNDYMLENPSGGSWRVKNGNLQVFNPTTGLWHTPFVTGPSGFEMLTIGAGEA